MMKKYLFILVMVLITYFGLVYVMDKGSSSGYNPLRFFSEGNPVAFESGIRTYLSEKGVYGEQANEIVKETLRTRSLRRVLGMLIVFISLGSGWKYGKLYDEQFGKKKSKRRRK